ncbi:TIGR01244 family sulfur transferase [Microbulbifer pacificus]|uniref:TIGR01244 family sulfur transferase n=1 Tax=Microbulbifer pacificus TaxID=407164 RepID=A0AAU0MZR4_9GAMM|nr:TIGR01244 family sulfur transferase [Microbulbifer pacificus]WOX05397.1 TIGR01244 family sulfur transferase [Microbulbifer pacificus]
MEFKLLDPQVSVSEELAPGAIQALADAGVEVLVCNRPEYESENLATFDELASAAAEAGMEFSAIPFSRGQMQPAHSQAFAELLDSGKRIHAFCRTGNRSCNLWAASRCVQGADKSELQAAAQQAGYDISGVLVTY